jgi:hypothetical protein
VWVVKGRITAALLKVAPSASERKEHAEGFEKEAEPARWPDDPGFAVNC